MSYYDSHLKQEDSTLPQSIELVDPGIPEYATEGYSVKRQGLKENHYCADDPIIYWTVAVVWSQ